jgi:hypothetical protein
MPRFVVLLHEMPPGSGRETHFDLMLEHQGVLRTWALENLPQDQHAVMGQRLADHRLAYLDYQGEVSGGRGTVARVDAGNYEMTHEGGEAIIIRVHGQKLIGTLTLTCDTQTDHRWRVALSSD